MSRNYAVQLVLVFSEPVCISDFDFILQNLREDGFDFNAEASPEKYGSKTSKVWTIDGTTTLCGGATEYEAHREIRQTAVVNSLLVEAVDTRWKCTDIVEWDVIYSEGRED